MEEEAWCTPTLASPLPLFPSIASPSCLHSSPLRTHQGGEHRSPSKGSSEEHLLE